MKDQKSGVVQIIKPDTVPFRGGCNTVLETQQIPMGGYSMVQNMRGTHPGFKKRKGQRVQHTTADVTNNVMSMYQFVKNRIAEKHFFAQFSDNDVLKATTDPPGVTTGVFGSESFSGSASSKPASWSNLKDTLLFSNGVDQHQIYHGTLTYIDRIIHYNGAAAPPTVPTLGYDYSDEATDGLTTTKVILDSWDTYANHECVFTKTPVPSSSQTFTVSAANATASILSGYYWNGAWTQVTGLNDGTAVDGKTMAQTGAVTWTLPTDAIPNYMYGECGYWMQFRVSAQLDSEVEVTKVQFTSAWQNIENVWDGNPVNVIETQFYDASADIYKTFGYTSIEIDSMVGTDSTPDKLHFASSDSICAIYVDVGTKPNTTVTTTVDAVYHWNGTAFVSVGTISDGTNGLSNSGWITFPRVTSHKLQFNKNQYYAYWYYLTVDKTLNDDVIISLYTQPYFDIDKFGKGYCNTVWKERAVYGFDRDQYIVVSAKGRPQVLNGDDYAILEPGDGRSNKPVAMHSFHNEMMVWQEEKGKEGGCLTLFEGYSPATFGKLVLSTKIGTMNAKTVAVVDGVYTSTKTDEVIGKIAFSLSFCGIFMSDGRYLTGVSDDIQNYFDPLKSECIRRGCKDQMWLSHDTAYNVLRIGLVSGASVQTATATSTTANKLVDTVGAFTTRKTVSGHPISHTIAIGDTVYNTTDSTSALITAIDSATTLSLDTDIMTSGEGYEIYSATCNLFPVFDLSEKTWGFDVFQQNLSCMTEVEAGSGQVRTIQMVGDNTGFVYQSDYGDDDVSTKIDSYIDIELNSDGRQMELREAVLTLKTGTHLTITPYVDSVAQTAITETSVSAVRNRYSLNEKGFDMKLRIQNDTVSEAFQIFGIGVKIYSNKAR